LCALVLLFAIHPLRAHTIDSIVSSDDAIGGGGDARISPSVARLVVAAAGEVGRNRRKLAVLADLENCTHARVQVEQDVAVNHPVSCQIK